MALFNAKEEPQDYNKHQWQIFLERMDDMVESIDALTASLDKTKEQLDFVTTKLEVLETKISADLKHDQELKEYKSQLFEVNRYVQSMLTTMITHKVSEPQVSPAMKAYLERKTNGSSGEKLPLP